MSFNKKAGKAQTTVAEEQERFWKSHYDALALRGAAWLDYGNPRVHQQTMDLALEHAQPIAQAHCADIGCGRGQLALALAELGAASVLGADASDALVSELAGKHAHVQWIHYSLRQRPATSLIMRFDRVFAVEVLQYVPLSLAMQNLWLLTAPGGRLVGIVPNRDCPFLAQAIARFHGLYAPPIAHELEAAISTLDDVQGSEVLGMWYTQQPDGPPYRVGSLANAKVDGSPNRLLFALRKAGRTD